jgi:biopolymer transport protein TolR
MSMEVGGKGVRSDINVTPLVDVVLVLLIIFMVITPMLQRGKPVVLPQAKELSALKGGDPIFVSITKDGKIWVDKTEYQKDALVEALNEQMAMHPGSPILVKGDKDTPYKVVRELIFELSKTHLMGVSLAGTQRKDKE